MKNALSSSKNWLLLAQNLFFDTPQMLQTWNKLMRNWKVQKSDKRKKNKKKCVAFFDFFENIDYILSIYILKTCLILEDWQQFTMCHLGRGFYPDFGHIRITDNLELLSGLSGYIRIILGYVSQYIRNVKNAFLQNDFFTIFVSARINAFMHE